MTVTRQHRPEHVRVLASTRGWSPLTGERAGPDVVFAAFTSPEQKQLCEDNVRGLTIGQDAVSGLITPSR